jgi:hypothetical protein
MRSTKIIAAMMIAGLSAPAAAQSSPPSTAATASPAQAVTADFVAGAAVRDSAGVQIGTIVSADATKAVIATSDRKIAVPMNLFRKDSTGVLMSITAQQFADAMAKAHARAEAAKAAAGTETKPAEGAAAPKQ